MKVSNPWGYPQIQTRPWISIETTMVTFGVPHGKSHSLHGAGIYANINAFFYWWDINVTIYSSTMDPMGYGFKVCEVLNMDLSHLKRGNLLPLHGDIHPVINQKNLATWMCGPHESQVVFINHTQSLCIEYISGNIPWNPTVFLVPFTKGLGPAAPSNLGYQHGTYPKIFHQVPSTENQW